jgi:hypothetical protein
MTFEVRASANSEQFIVAVYLDGKRVSGTYTVSHITDGNHKMMHGDSLVDHLMDCPEGDVKRGWWESCLELRQTIRPMQTMKRGLGCMRLLPPLTHHQAGPDVFPARKPSTLMGPAPYRAN